MPGIFDELTLAPNPTKCFVMMPFEVSFDPFYRLIFRCCTEQELECMRVDADANPGKITDKIYERIAEAGIIIADMTGRNPNVFYELGLAHAVSNNVILLTQSTDDVPFDLRDFTHIEYSNSVAGADKLLTDLSKALNSIVRSSNLSYQAQEAELHSENDDLGVLHLKADISRREGDIATSESYLQRALELAQKGMGSAPEIGNCAIEAESGSFLDLAEPLYELALERDSGHINNRQCYVSFLLDHRSNNPQKLQVAARLLDALENIPERRERTRGLRTQYLMLTQDKSAGDSDQLEDYVSMLVGDAQFAGLRDAMPAIWILSETKQYDKLRSIVRDMKDGLDGGDALVLDRILADAYASSEIEKWQLKAIEIYSQMVSEGADAEVKHNLATLLNALESMRDVSRIDSLWRDAYKEQPQDSAIRKSFVGFLLAQGRVDDAQKVIKGQPLDEVLEKS